MKSVAICIDSELSNKNYSKATERLNSFNQSGSTSDFTAFYDLKIELKKNDKNWFQLTEEQTRILDALENSKTEFISGKVKVLQNFINGNHKTFTPLPIKSNNVQVKKPYIGKPSDESFENILEVQYLTNSKTLMFISTRPGSTYQIVNNIGQVVKSGTVNNALERTDVSFLQTGVYHIRMTSPDNLVNYQDKFVVQ